MNQQTILKNPPIQYRPIPYTPFYSEFLTSKSKYKSLQKLQLVLGAVTLFPIRLILAIVTLIICYLVSAVGHYLRPKECLNKYCKFFGDQKGNFIEKFGVWVIIAVNRLVRLTLFFLGLTSIELKGKVPIDYDQGLR